MRAPPHRPPPARARGLPSPAREAPASRDSTPKRLDFSGAAEPRSSVTQKLRAAPDGGQAGAVRDSGKPGAVFPPVALTLARLPPPRGARRDIGGATRARGRGGDRCGWSSAARAGRGAGAGTSASPGTAPGRPHARLARPLGEVASDATSNRTRLEIATWPKRAQLVSQQGLPFSGSSAPAAAAPRRKDLASGVSIGNSQMTFIDNQCANRVATGAAVGGALGGSIGALYGTYESFRYKIPGLYKIRFIGQTTLSSAAVFGLFLGAGSLLHCGRQG